MYLKQNYIFKTCFLANHFAQAKGLLKIVYMLEFICLKIIVYQTLPLNLRSMFGQSFWEVTHGKSPIILSVSYCVRICWLALDILP